MSLGFSRQEHWSGLPFPFPMHESEKWKWKWKVKVMSDSSRPHGLQPTRLLRPWDFRGKSTGVGCHCLLCLLAPAPSKSQGGPLVLCSQGHRFWMCHFLELRKKISKIISYPNVKNSFCGKFFKYGSTRPPYLPPEKSVRRSRSNS